MPEEWYNRFALNSDSHDTSEDKERKTFNKTIIANKKPYFMCYIYPQEMTKYKKFVETEEMRCIHLFGLTIDELEKVQNKTLEQSNYLDWYYKKMPVSVNNCTMNRICKAVEDEFENYNCKVKASAKFDYHIMQHKQNAKYPKYTAINKIYQEYIDESSYCAIIAKKQRYDKDQIDNDYVMMIKKYQEKCIETCTDELELCDILLDLCYKKEKSKRFAWDICGDTIIENLLKLNNWEINYYVLDNDGEIEYCGKKYRKVIRKVGV